MTIIKSLDEVINVENTVVTIGNFDGIHKGHIKLIKEAVKEAKTKNYKSVVFTFENHPMRYFRADSIKHIITNEEKVKIFKDLGVDIVFMIPFDEYMTKISATDFVKTILHEKLKCKMVIVGHDFTFARNKEGNASLLESLGKKYNMKVKVIEPIKIKGRRVSSSYIRNLINDGNVSEIKDFLGRNYFLEGEVIHARKIGRTIGFPTANLKAEDKLIIPKNGIYAVKVYIKNKVYYGATNIGYNPTVNGKALSIETNIIDFDEEIYGEIIKVEFLDRIRDEKKFNSLDELKSQLRKDVNFVYKKYVYK
ncbi:bifunctional riboflavin kinase/FAD synthetase [Paraclostridium bifermentans]|uniref:Riboflavin biosynthesis protein n=1 Tax=Paraclostridium bifermentans TaxID=1490 RepID=A0A5P3XBN9_PARBF|nr:bifunctional riboflavin kinase/FAD synthetase [Paraclostridium bifermentans]MCU9808076.1 bifunctional riboflavin kinase/FAD synthetase [Paraclostridium sp. AKS46]MDV8116140.1 bifunctional riboflavin kinase/FAD synthetase [Bacillus sp. BAU-SS-2023]EQK47344.1 riboflavin biosynthesis protein RibF [[Clostridium] bifermentans ATCC 19299] [Paraclostridium bifermentans ATCC 19299]MCE9674493.1 bifunctional riboflavin kinase/FAD synthetase [Paraclostridium bifermentans]MCR1875066.1 bifunctional ribo